jgi:hypothetical protein
MLHASASRHQKVHRLWNPDAEAFFNALKKLIQDAISLHIQHSILTAEQYRSGRKTILKKFRTLYQHPPLLHHEVDNIRQWLITFTNELFVFLKYPVIEPTNNFAEQQIRNSFLLRKLIFDNMTACGKMNVALAIAIIITSMQRAFNSIEILCSIATKRVTPELLEQFGL